MNLDVINGIFELVGSIFIWGSVRQLVRDKGYAGLFLPQIMVYTAWGAWNLLYYPSLGQWWSTIAGVNVLVANLTWIILAGRYGHATTID